MIAFGWLYVAAVSTVIYGVVGFVREIVRVAPGNPTMHYAWWILAGLTAFALVRVLDRINKNILVAYKAQTSYTLGARDLLYAEINRERRDREEKSRE